MSPRLLTRIAPTAALVVALGGFLFAIPAPPAGGDEPKAQTPTPATEATVTLPWVADVAKAKEQAKREKKDLFIDFTGSDWCGWCKRLDREVFETAAFRDAMKDKFVFLYLDFPKNEEAMAKVVDEKLNESLREKYGVQGFPTILLCDADGNPYARTGYVPGGPEKYFGHIEELRVGGEKVKALLANREDTRAEEMLVAAFPVLSDQGLLGYPEYAKYLDAAEKIEDLAKGAKDFRQKQALTALLSKEPTPEFWPQVHEFLLANPELTGPEALNACWGCVNEHLVKKPDLAGATALLQRMLRDPLIAENDQGKTMIEQKLAEIEQQMGGK